MWSAVLLIWGHIDGYAHMPDFLCNNTRWKDVYHPDLYRYYTPFRCAQYYNRAHACMGFAWRPSSSDRRWERENTDGRRLRGDGEKDLKNYSKSNPLSHNQNKAEKSIVGNFFIVEKQ